MKALSTHAANTCSSGHEGNTTFYLLWPETLLKQTSITQKILKTQKLFNYTIFTATQLPYSLLWATVARTLTQCYHSILVSCSI